MSAAVVGEQKYGSGEIRAERAFGVIAVENSISPDQKIRVIAGEFLPVVAAAPRHALADEEEICMRDGLVVKLGLSPRSGVTFERETESLERFERSALAEVCECQVHMILMMELTRQGVSLKAMDEFVIAHLR
jgi:hypothetical protein